MSQAQRAKGIRRQVRRTVSTEVAVNVLELHRFLRRGFWGRLTWLLVGR